MPQIPWSASGSLDRYREQLATFDEGGKPWEQIVRDRIALMDGYPAIKAKYSAAVGDAITISPARNRYIVLPW